MSEFKIGNRVKYIGQIPELKGKVGTVVRPSADYYDVGVAFDDRISFLHGLDGFCEKNHGWYCHNAVLELISEHRFNVIITSVGDTTTAKLLHGKKVEKEVSVKRYYKDDYSEEAAVEAVCKKLFGEDKPKEDAEPMGINCKAVYIGISRGGFTHGKIYEFSDGRCLDDYGHLRPNLKRHPLTDTDDFSFNKKFVVLVNDDEQHGRYSF